MFTNLKAAAKKNSALWFQKRNLQNLSRESTMFLSDQKENSTRCVKKRTLKHFFHPQFPVTLIRSWSEQSNENTSVNKKTNIARFCREMNHHCQVQIQLQDQGRGSPVKFSWKATWSKSVSNDSWDSSKFSSVCEKKLTLKLSRRFYCCSYFF